jgi:vanillate/3-O-methylgallate O-demethylase
MTRSAGDRELLAAMRRTPEGYYNVRFGKPEYTDWLDESMSWKHACYIGDWSFLWERRFRGPDALKLFEDFSVNSFASFAIDQSKHVIHTNVDGKVIHEGILTRLGEEEFMLFGRGGFWLDYQLRHGGYDAESEPDDWFNFQVSGPNSIHVLERLAGPTVRDVKFMHNGHIEIAGHQVLALRQGMAGEIGFELQGPNEHAQDVYDAVLQAGQEFGMRRLGARVSQVNHLEACFPTIVADYLPAIFGDELTDYLAEFRAAMPAFAQTFNIAGSFQADHISAWYRSPVELGWTRNIKFDHEFLGREALEGEVNEPNRMIRTLVWNGTDVTDVYASLFRDGEPFTFMDMPRDQRGFMWADQVLRDGKAVGVATSRGYSYYFRKMLSLCVIDIDHADLGTEVTVIWGNPNGPQREIRATVEAAPYKTDNRRADLHTPPTP